MWDRNVVTREWRPTHKEGHAAQYCLGAFTNVKVTKGRIRLRNILEESKLKTQAPEGRGMHCPGFESDPEKMYNF